MSVWPVLLVAAPIAAVAARRHSTSSAAVPRPLDVSKSGQVFALAADWLRVGDTEAARSVLRLVGDDAWQFARDEVVAVSPSPRVAAMADRMAADALLDNPAGRPSNTDLLAQIETLRAVATEIAARLGRSR